MNRNIGGKTKYMRQRKNLSPYALATKASVAQSTLSYIGKGARQRTEKLQALYTALDITMLELSTCSSRRQPCALLSRKTPGASLFFGHTQNSSGIWLRWLSAKEVARRQCTVSL